LADTYKTIAWNGVTFSVPNNWEPSRIGPRYLQFEDDTGPVFELKWQQIKGRYPIDRHLKRLVTRHGRRNGVDVKTAPMPETWAPILNAFENRFFTWDSAGVSGQGVALYCNTCKTAHLLQFIRRDIIKNKRLCASILNAFRDHPQKDDAGTIHWQIYDIKAVLPGSFGLQGFTFQPGAFELKFKGPYGTEISLHRWGPASVLLEGAGLDRFISDQLPWIDALAADKKWFDQQVLHVNTALFSTPWSKWALVLLRKRMYGWLFAAHDEDHNKIMAVSALGRRPLPDSLFRTISDHYEMV
jgi:hypothetical protein